MSENAQLEKSEALPVNVVTTQFPALSRELLTIVRELSDMEIKWPTIVLIGSGALLLLVSVIMRIPGGFLVANLTTWEFVTMIIASAALMLAGATFKIYQSRSWRQIIMEQQALGMQILHKEVDIARESHNRKNRRQWGAVIIFHSKIRKFSRR